MDCYQIVTVLVEILINWDNFYYYESRGLMIFVTVIQIIVMTILILILKAVDLKRKRFAGKCGSSRYCFDAG